MRKVIAAAFYEAAMDDDPTHYEQDRALRAAPWDEAAFARTFRHEIATVSDGVRIHYVVGGGGPAVVLLHGNPQSWREWRLIMPALVNAGHRAVVPDLRGFGQSDKPPDGYDAGTVGEDIRQVITQLGLGTVSLVGPGVSVGAAYAWAAAHPTEVRRLVLMEAIPAGLEPPSPAPPMLKGKPIWHPGFMMTPDLPEVLLAGRERPLLEYWFRDGAFDPTVFSGADIDVYVKTFAALGGVRGALAHYRAHPASRALNQKLSQCKLAIPVLAIGAALSYGRSIEVAARGFADKVQGIVVAKCGHWIPEERPLWLAKQLISFLGEERL